MKFENYLDKDFGQKMFFKIGARNKRIRIYPIAFPGRSFLRMGLQLSTTMEEYQTFHKLRSCRDSRELWDALHNSGVLNNDYSKDLNFWYRQPAKEATA